MTPSANQYVTFTSNGQPYILISPEGEFVADIFLNGDGTTTVTQGKLVKDGQDIRVRFLLSSLIGTTQVTRLPSPIGIAGGAQLQFQVLA